MYTDLLAPAAELKLATSVILSLLFTWFSTMPPSLLLSVFRICYVRRLHSVAHTRVTVGET